MQLLHTYRLLATHPNGIEYETGAPFQDGGRFVIVGPPVDLLEGEFARLVYEGPSHALERPGPARLQEWADAHRPREPFRGHVFTSPAVASDAVKAFDAALARNLVHAFGQGLPRGGDGEWRAHVVPVLRGGVQYGMGSLGLPYDTCFKRIYDHLIGASPDAPHIETLDRDLRETLEGGSYFVPVNVGAEALEAAHRDAEELARRREVPKRARPIEAGTNTKTCAELGLLVFQVLRTLGPDQVPDELAPLLRLPLSVTSMPPLAEDAKYKYLAFDADALGSCACPRGEIAFGVRVMGVDEIPAVDAKTLRASMRVPTREQRVWYFDKVRPVVRTHPITKLAPHEVPSHDLRTHGGQWCLALASRSLAPILPFVGSDRSATRLCFEILVQGVGFAPDVAATILHEWYRSRHEAKTRLEAELRQAQGRVLEFDIGANKKIPWAPPPITEDFESPAAVLSAVRFAGYSESTPWLEIGEHYRAPTQAEAAEIASRMARDPWLPVLADFVGERPTVKSDELVSHLQAAADLRGDATPHTHARINACMVKLGFEKKQVQIAGNRFHAFVRVPAAEVSP